jgi:hypothetical protein
MGCKRANNVWSCAAGAKARFFMSFVKQTSLITAWNITAFPQSRPYYNGIKNHRGGGPWSDARSKTTQRLEREIAPAERSGRLHADAAGCGAGPNHPTLKNRSTRLSDDYLAVLDPRGHP